MKGSPTFCSWGFPAPGGCPWGWGGWGWGRCQSLSAAPHPNLIRAGAHPSTYARNSSLRKLPIIPKLSSVRGVVKNNFLPRNGSKFWEKTIPPFNGEKKKFHGLTYVDKQLIRLKRSNFSGRLQSVLGNRAASIFISIYVLHLPHLLPTNSMFCQLVEPCL